MCLSGFGKELYVYWAVRKGTHVNWLLMLTQSFKMISALSFLKVVKNLLTVIAILVGALILLTSVQPTDAVQEEAPGWELHHRKRCFYINDHGRPDIKMDCYRAYCRYTGDDCTWLWGGACFKLEGGYCFE